jgi:hypothetical protein
MATTVLFTLMMDACARERAASDYTAQACAVVVSQGLAAALSGVTAQTLGYNLHFAGSALIGFFGVLLTAFILQSTRLRGLAVSNSVKTAGLALLILGISLSGAGAHAQTSTQTTERAKSKYEFGLHMGTFLPSRVPGVTEIMPGWGARGSYRSNKGVFELDTLLSRGDGAVYNSLSFDYRLDVRGMSIPAHFVFGLHADNYEGPGRKAQFSGGWHYGGGFSAPISSNLSFRTDFKYRFSPGASLYVGLGLAFLTDLGGGGT